MAARRRRRARGARAVPAVLLLRGGPLGFCTGTTTTVGVAASGAAASLCLPFAWLSLGIIIKDPRALPGVVPIAEERRRRDNSSSWHPCWPMILSVLWRTARIKRDAQPQIV